jgi:hypothetical protein
MVESIDSPQGDQVERTAAPTATTEARTTSREVMRVSRAGGLRPS